MNMERKQIRSKELKDAENTYMLTKVRKLGANVITITLILKRTKPYPLQFETQFYL